jgi:hypothetical protein
MGRTAYFAPRDYTFQHFRDGAIGVDPVFQRNPKK